MIETTTHHNTTWRTFAKRVLKTLTESTVRCTYDPKVYDSIIAQINVNQSITVTFWNGDKLNFFGVLRSFEPSGVSDDESGMPEADVGITPTNVDPADGTETGPNYITSAGTD